MSLSLSIAEYSSRDAGGHSAVPFGRYMEKFDGEARPRQSAGDKTVKRQMVDYLNKSGKVKVEIEELEYCVTGARPECRDVNIQYIVMDARDERSRKLFAELCGNG